MSIQWKNVLGQSDQGDPTRARLGPRAPLIAQLMQPHAYNGGGDIRGHFEALKKSNWLATLDSGTYTLSANSTTGLLEAVLTAHSDADDVAQLQESMDGGTTGVIRFVPLAGRVHFAELEVKTSAVATGAFLFGFATLDTTLLASGVEACSADLIGFVKTKAAATILGRVMKATTATDTADLATMVNATYMKLGILIDGVSGVHFFVNDVPTPQLTLTNLPTAALALSIAVSGASQAATIKNLWYGTCGGN